MAGRSKSTVTINMRRRRKSRQPARKKVAISTATRNSGVVQGVGRTTRRPFGSRRSVVGTMGLNALSPAHLALPRSVAPYTVVRLTDTFSLTDSLSIWGPMTMPTSRAVGNTGVEASWSSFVGAGSVVRTNPVNGASNTRFYQSLGFDKIGKYTRLVPSAYTIQVFNLEPVLNTTGILYGGRLQTIEQLCGDTDSWDTLSSELVSYCTPRLMSAAKLAFRGVTANAIPGNMEKLANFTGGAVHSTGTAVVTETWDGTNDNRGANFEGFVPLFVHNPNGIQIQVLVTVEYRLRFDMANPACSTHMHHRATPVKVWDDIVGAVSKGAAVFKDIAEGVAYVGSAMGSARAQPAIAVD